MTDIVDRKALTLAGARRILAAAEAEALSMKLNVVLAVVDDGGHLLQMVRMDGARLTSIDIAIGKARTAALARRPTQELEQAINAGRTAALAPYGPTLSPQEGGVPILAGGQVVGAIGVSGAAPQDDATIARAGSGILAS